MSTERNPKHNNALCSGLFSYWHNHPPYGTRRVRCFGRRPRSSQCNQTVKDPWQAEPGFLPTCRLHRAQKIRAGVCQSVMPCGFKCLEAFEWNPPYPQFCSLHKNTPFPCYFLKLPVELRFEVYGYLLPDKEIPVGRQGILKSSDCRADSDRTYIMSLLLLNKQITEEVQTLLYGRHPVSVVITDQQIGMYNCFWNRHEWRADRNVTGYEYLKDWTQSIPRFNYNFIRHLTLNIWAYPFSHEASLYGNCNRVRALWKRQARYSGLSGRSDVLGHTWMYDICDNLRRFVKHFLHQNKQNLITLDVKLVVRPPASPTSDAWENTMIAAINILLEPTELFRGITSAKVTFEPEPKQSTLERLLNEPEYRDPKRMWENLVMSSKPLLPEPPLFAAYAKLEEFTEIMIDMKVNLGDLAGQKSLDRLLHLARMAKELLNYPSFQLAQGHIFALWEKYVMEQTLFISEMSKRVSDIGIHSPGIESLADSYTYQDPASAGQQWG